MQVDSNTVKKARDISRERVNLKVKFIQRRIAALAPTPVSRIPKAHVNVKYTYA